MYSGNNNEVFILIFKVMWKSSNILETGLAVLNFKNETIEWKANSFNPKQRLVYLDLFKRSNSGETISTLNLI